MIADPDVCLTNMEIARFVLLLLLIPVVFGIIFFITYVWTREIRGEMI